MSMHIGIVNSVITEIKATRGLYFERLHAVIMLRSVRDAGPAFTSVVAALKAQEEETLAIDRINRQLTETARDSKVNVVKKGTGVRAVAAFLGTEHDVDMRTSYRYGEKGHISPDCTNKPKPAGSQRLWTTIETSRVAGRMRLGQTPLMLCPILLFWDLVRSRYWTSQRCGLMMGGL